MNSLELETHKMLIALAVKIVSWTSTAISQATKSRAILPSTLLIASDCHWPQDNKTLASCDRTGSCRLWDRGQGEEVSTFLCIGT